VSDWSQDSVLLSFQQAVAASCENNIFYDGVRVTRANYTALEASSLHYVALLDVTNDVTVTYVVGQQVHGFNDSALAYDIITTTLTENVEANIFTSYLRSFALENGAVSLGDASSGGIEIVNTLPPTAAPTFSHAGNHKLGDGAVAATVIMTVFGIVCIVVGVIYFTKSGTPLAKSEYDAPHDHDDALHEL
jgi:hypothetical protein